MAKFTPVSAAIGGALIGLAAALLMLLTGRIAGISGILGGCLGTAGADKGWRLAFLGVLILVPLTGAGTGYGLTTPQMTPSFTVIIAAGLLVGFGARFVGRCTDCHARCV